MADFIADHIFSFSAESDTVHMSIVHTSEEIIAHESESTEIN